MKNRESRWKPLKIDRTTTFSDKGGFARIYVELDLQKPLLPAFDHFGENHAIEYEGLHLVCFNYGTYGHHTNQCLLKSPTEPHRKQQQETLMNPTPEPTSGEGATQEPEKEETATTYLTGLSKSTEAINVGKSLGISKQSDQPRVTEESPRSIELNDRQTGSLRAVRRSFGKEATNKSDTEWTSVGSEGGRSWAGVVGSNNIVSPNPFGSLRSELETEPITNGSISGHGDHDLDEAQHDQAGTSESTCLGLLTPESRRPKECDGVILDEQIKEGSGSRTFPSLIRDLVSNHGLDFVALFETRCGGRKAHQIASQLGFRYFEIVDADGFKGGIWCCWSEKFKTVEVVETNQQFIHLRLENHERQK
ncbi:uncharacterized protein LOC114761155 [Neltuma alba]|uniref:uncharacterized protein LOC114761155 n=1 Tax=Neltuma alba TaxID=207710 RepID=UPI0010A2D5A3|nr:uncharacterized protein LOC114761155 [Prosopis alba]